MVEDDRRRARRAFVREHHPDRGGDPTKFTEGLARFEDPDQDSDQPARSEAPDQPVESDGARSRRRIRVAASVTWSVFGKRRHSARFR